jgi:hypothetical protein
MEVEKPEIYPPVVGAASTANTGFRLHSTADCRGSGFLPLPLSALLPLFKKAPSATIRLTTQRLEELR